MLTIGELAKYAGTTVRAVRHYDRVGLLPEPERDRSGYRSYDAAAVVRLIRIRTLAAAGVPLARVQHLLDAGPEEFSAGVDEIDQDLRSEIERLRAARGRLAQLASGEQLTLPCRVVDYLDRLRGLGVDERYIEMERDAWIIIAAQVPNEIDALIADKHQELDDPDTVQMYLLFNEALDWSPEDPRVEELADLLERLMTRAAREGDAGIEDLDDSLIAFLDATTVESSPVAKRLLQILNDRGWKGWTRIERVPGSAS